MPISEARIRLPELVNLADSLFRKTYITVKGKIKAILINPEELSLMEETLEVLSDPKTMKAINQGKKEVKAGKVVDWQDLKKELRI